jgi:hypothetical protein
MEILEMPVAEELEETPEWGEAAPIRLEEQELDLRAFELWQQASRPDEDQ